MRKRVGIRVDLRVTAEMVMPPSEAERILGLSWILLCWGPCARRGWEAKLHLADTITTWNSRESSELDAVRVQGCVSDHGRHVDE